ncbi:biotin transporter BioY [Marinactinospora thermotolerans]|uniref:Biotin transporter n=1 Tax=Marinactinospora thermotolerans DSM 45154 TaxID=1122192 RepID=A0A1T4ST50_9ACTN|nr:biotin transporter BioY [Marinactinospora thermotolerans]SKA31434.1 biotin transport system substrate-specific component [Marinactinospora thermotolerans DSM 45154]
MSQQRTDTTQSTVLTAVFAALIAALGLVPAIAIGILPVPITVQTLGVMLAGALLGPLRGGLAATVVVVLSIAGMPILAGGRGGMGVLLGPTGGYLIGWIPAAIVIGLLVKYWAIRFERQAVRYLAVGASVFTGGVLVIYLFGVPWTAVVTGLPLATSAIGSLAFLPGDLVKVVVATLIAVNVHRSYRRLLGA